VQFSIYQDVLGLVLSW